MEALRTHFARLPHLVLLALVLTGLLLALRTDKVATGLDAIVADGKLIVVTRTSPTSFYLGREGEATGFEADLARGFARTLGLEVEFVPLESVEEILDFVQSGRAHIAAAGLVRTAAREAAHRFSPAYRKSAQVVVCRKGDELPEDITALGTVNLVVTEDSAHAEALQAKAAEVEGLSWSEEALSPEELMQRVWENEIDCTVADEPVFDIARHQHPELVKTFDLTEAEPIAWVITPGAEELATKIDEWMEDPKTRQGVERLIAAHFGFFRDFDYVDLARFHRDVEVTLPAYERDIRRAARRNELPWRLVAAMAYQESRWKPDAVSRTGVRGLMMLTESTAESVGVADRTDPQESIWGGARYFARLLARVPEDVEGEDRYWFALAAYNMGMSHVYDARRLATRNGLNKSSWSDVKSVLRHLSEPATYRTLRHGRARGYEARRYVEQVRTYWHVLKLTR